MGKFDRKVNKHEPDAPKTQKIKSKKIQQKNLHALETNKSAEKERNMKILNLLQKEKDYAAGDKVKAATNTNKMLRKYKSKEERFRKMEK